MQKPMGPDEIPTFVAEIVELLAYCWRFARYTGACRYIHGLFNAACYEVEHNGGLDGSFDVLALLKFVETVPIDVGQVLGYVVGRVRRGKMDYFYSLGRTYCPVHALSD